MDVSDQTPFRVMTAYIINSAQRQTAAVDHDAIKALLSLCRRPAGRPAGRGSHPVRSAAEALLTQHSQPLSGVHVTNSQGGPKIFY